jgi:hypothetical protein
MEKDFELTPQPHPVNNDAETIDYLKGVVEGLKQKLVVSEGKVTEMEEVERQLSESEKSRIDLSLCLKESGNKVLAENKASTKFKDELISKNRELQVENQALKERVNDLLSKNILLEEQLKELRKHTNILDTDIRLMKANTTNEDAMAKLLHDLNELLKTNKKTSNQV